MKLPFPTTPTMDTKDLEVHLGTVHINTLRRLHDRLDWYEGASFDEYKELVRTEWDRRHPKNP